MSFSLLAQLLLAQSQHRRTKKSLPHLFYWWRGKAWVKKIRTGEKGRLWYIYGILLGKLWDNLWEKCWKFIGKWWEIYGNVMVYVWEMCLFGGKWWEAYGKMHGMAYGTTMETNLGRFQAKYGTTVRWYGKFFFRVTKKSLIWRSWVKLPPDRWSPPCILNL